MLNKIITKLFLVFAGLVFLSNICKAQSGYQRWSGQGLEGQDILRLSGVFADNKMFTITDSGKAFRSTDMGLTWVNAPGLEGLHYYNELRARGTQSNLSKPIQNKYDGVLTTSADSLWAVGNGGLIWFTSNGGTNWIQQVSGITGDIFAIDFPDNHNGWAADIQGHLIHTTNAGANWVLQANDMGFSAAHIYFTDLLHGWASGYYSGTSSTVKYTSNGGTNWDNRTPPGNFDTYAYFTHIQFINQNTGWLTGTNYNHYTLYRTTNAGVNWDSCTVTPAPHILSGISFVNALTGYICGDTLIFKTTNGGVNWISQTLPAFMPYLYDIQFTDPDTGMAVGQFATILYTTSGGDPIGITPISNNVPKGFDLYQNYPNPFNPATTIKFDLQKKSDVKLVIYDLTSRSIQTESKDNLNPGSYEYKWDASNYASGVYFYKLITDGFTETKKMILIK